MYLGQKISSNPPKWPKMAVFRQLILKHKWSNRFINLAACYETLQISLNKLTAYQTKELMSCVAAMLRRGLIPEILGISRSSFFELGGLETIAPLGMACQSWDSCNVFVLIRVEGFEHVMTAGGREKFSLLLW
jgi:hypothetical protein